jgi:hypothetical protein
LQQPILHQPSKPTTLSGATGRALFNSR